MKIDSATQSRLEATFGELNKVAAAKAFPHPKALANALEEVLPSRITKNTTTVIVKPQVVLFFTTAAVDMWMRGVHSFLISISLTKTSPIWASVSGYYSSHYVVRAFAHLLGYFQLYRLRRIVQLDHDQTKKKYVCKIINKKPQEHEFYWTILKESPSFKSDPLFSLSSYTDEVSDAVHRNMANYADHLLQTPPFRVLDSDAAKNRVKHISQITFSAPPIPDISKFPDLESVQIMAYHRLIRFRQFVDEIAGPTNRFWSVYRTPAWAREFMDFQITEQGGLGSDHMSAYIRQR